MRWWRALLARFGWLDASERIDRDDLRRLGVLLLVCMLCAFLVVDYVHAPQDALRTGDVAPRTVKAPFTFTYADHAAHEDHYKSPTLDTLREKFPIWTEERELRLGDLWPEVKYPIK